MILISFFLLYLGIKRKFEPLLLVGIAFGCLLVNVSNFFSGGESSAEALYHPELWDAFLDHDEEAASIGIIGGADGPTDIFLTTRLAPHLLGPIAIAAYSYIA